MSTSQIASIEKHFFMRGCGLNDEQIKEGLRRYCVVGIHSSLKRVDVMNMKQPVPEVLKKEVVICVSDRA